jgi:hypothetical protein
MTRKRDVRNRQSAGDMSDNARGFGRRFWLVTCALIAIGIARIVSTYGEFTQTWDEPWHIACGMQLLHRGVYGYETMHPPLARVAAALPLYLAGGGPMTPSGTLPARATRFFTNRANTGGTSR